MSLLPVIRNTVTSPAVIYGVKVGGQRALAPATAIMFRRYLHLNSRNLATKPATSTTRLVSTQTYDQVQALERIFDNLHWHDAKDKVEEMRHLMDEHKTNHSVKKPDNSFEEMITNKLHMIEEMAGKVGAKHQDIFHRVFDLDHGVKYSLYGCNSKREYHALPKEREYDYSPFELHATNTPSPPPIDLHKVLPHHTFYQDYLSDQSTWPLFIIVLGTFAWAGYMSEDTMLSRRDTQKKRQNMDEEHHPRFLERFVQSHGGVNPEGHGINHEEWSQKKKIYMDA